MQEKWFRQNQLCLRASYIEEISCCSLLSVHLSSSGVPPGCSRSLARSLSHPPHLVDHDLDGEPKLQWRAKVLATSGKFLLISNNSGNNAVTDLVKGWNNTLLMYGELTVEKTSGGILAHSSIQYASRSLRLRGFRAATRTFSSHQRFSIGLRSGFMAGQSSP